MDKRYDHKAHEERIYSFWEKSNYFTPRIDRAKKPFVIIMPPPNANATLHMGNATFVAISDALIRYHRMLGVPTLWLPGVDHAGILTQAVFERQLAKEGKTRYDLGRKEFFRQVYDFCMANKSTIESQLRSIGASCDWTRGKFTLDPQISKIVADTFVKLHNDGLIYRGVRLVNWCTRCRTTLSDLETEDKETEGNIYHLDYGPVTIATTRPETIFADVAVAVNPKDKRYKKLIGRTAKVPLIEREIPIIADESVDPEFGTGALKITPGHDLLDAEIGRRHNLEVISVIDFDGRLIPPSPKEYVGLGIKEARARVISDLEKQGHLKKTEDHKSVFKVCERCKTVIEPLVSRQWFVKIETLAKPAIKAVKEGKTKITPVRFQKMYFYWMNNIQDWPISRQIWWGHQLPVYYCATCQTANSAKEQFELLRREDPRSQTDLLEDPIVAVEKPEKCPRCGGEDLLQDPDTLDTWFSSGQWPFTTLGYPDSDDFEYFYPTSVMNTAYEILFLWVARMIMFGLYRTGKVPFHTALINGILRDEHGRKMSKSAGNVVDPLEMAELYGADAVRAGLIFGRDTGTDLSVSRHQLEERIKAQRNFANKIWNIARYILETNAKRVKTEKKATSHEDDKWILDELNQTIKQIITLLQKHKTGQALEQLYDFTWHKFADVYIEKTKGRREEAQFTLVYVLQESLKLLHPFMPFVTETIWQEGHKKYEDSGFFKEEALVVASWPRS